MEFGGSSAISTKDLFFGRTGLDWAQSQAIVADALHGADDGELFLEYRQSESVVFDDGRVKAASFDTSQGFGLRAVVGEAAGYGHSSELAEGSLQRAASAVSEVKTGYTGHFADRPTATNQRLYTDINPLIDPVLEEKIALLVAVDAYVRDRDHRVRQVTASLSGEWQAVGILRPDGEFISDVRPLVRLNVGVVVEQNGRMEHGSFGAGGRVDFKPYAEPDRWQAIADEALRQAVVNLSSAPAPAGEMTVVLKNGWPGILLHEAIGHGLEGDFNRKKTSAFAGLVGQNVATPLVSVVDDGTLLDRRGSLTIDDEGTPAQCTSLIEDGVLVGFMQDRMNARLMGARATGNGRRQSFAHVPMPRMTNTYMRPGSHKPDEIIQSVDKGIYAVAFGGGQVDITSGKFVFSCTEAYEIRNGKLGSPLKGATLIGNGPEVLTKVSMVGDDLELDSGVGTCGKDGQSVPVGVGQPTLRIDGLTVGGTAV